MKVIKAGNFFIVGNGNLFVKSVGSSITFTTSDGEAQLCFTKVEAEAIRDFIEQQFNL